MRMRTKIENEDAGEAAVAHGTAAAAQGQGQLPPSRPLSDLIEFPERLGDKRFEIGDGLRLAATASSRRARRDRVVEGLADAMFRA